jgi:hypothetical protein
VSDEGTEALSLSKQVFAWEDQKVSQAKQTPET